MKDAIYAGKTKILTQEVYIGGAIHNCELQLWDTYINALEKSRTYHVKTISVSQFNGRDSSFKETEGTGDVVSSNTAEDNYSQECEIVAVL